jgi:hypothetical protein
MDEERTSSVARLDQRSDAVREGTPLTESEQQPPPQQPQPQQPQRLLGELSKASQSLAEVLDVLTAEKRELESRAVRLERELERAREAAALAKKEALAQVQWAKEETASEVVSTARDAVRHRARAERAERLLALVGGDREASVFSVTVGRLARRRASRDLLREAVSQGVQLRLSAHHGWLDSLFVAEAEGEPVPLGQFLMWARERFADDELREKQS